MDKVFLVSFSFEELYDIFVMVEEKLISFSRLLVTYDSSVSSYYSVKINYDNYKNLYLKLCNSLDIKPVLLSSLPHKNGVEE